MQELLPTCNERDARNFFIYVLDLRCSLNKSAGSLAYLRLSFSSPPNICRLTGTGSSHPCTCLVGVANARSLIKMSDMDEDVYDEEEDYDLVSERPF